MTESALAFLHMQLGARVALGEEGTPLQRGREALNGGLPGYGLYRTKDAKWLAVGALEPHFFQGVCEVLGHPEWLEDAFDFGYGSRATRLKLEAAFAEKTQAEWLERFRDRDVCVEPVLEGDDVLADPQLVARGIVGEGVTVEGDRFSALRTPVRAGVPLRPARDLGADTAEVLGEAGFSAAEIAELAR